MGHFMVFVNLLVHLTLAWYFRALSYRLVAAILMAPRMLEAVRKRLMGNRSRELLEMC